MVGVCGLTSYLCLFYKNEQGNTVCDSIRSVIALIGTGRKVFVCLFTQEILWFVKALQQLKWSISQRRDGRKMISSSKISARKKHLTIDSPRKERSFGRPAWLHSVHSQPRSVQPRCCAVRLTVLRRRWRLWLFSRCIIRLTCATAKPHSKVKTLPVLIFSQQNSLQGRVTFHHL